MNGPPSYVTNLVTVEQHHIKHVSSLQEDCWQNNSRAAQALVLKNAPTMDLNLFFNLSSFTKNLTHSNSFIIEISKFSGSLCSSHVPNTINIY